MLDVEAIYAFSAVGFLDEMPLASEGTFVVPNGYLRGLAASQHSFAAARRRPGTRT